MQFFKTIKYLALVCFALSAFFLFGFMNERRDFKEAEGTYEDMRVEAFSKHSVQQIQKVSIPAEGKGERLKGQDLHVKQKQWFLERKSQFPNMVGWLSWEGEKISYPVMQAGDNEFYLNHLPDGSKNKLGSIFLDSSANEDFSSQISVIYGHMVKSGEMFGSLSGYRNQSYYEKYPEVTLDMEEGRKTIQILASYLADGERETYPNHFDTLEDWESYMRKIKENSFINGIWEAEPDNRLVIFSTCAYDFKDARLAVLGRFITQ